MKTFILLLFLAFAFTVSADPNAEASLLTGAANSSGGGTSAPTPDVNWWKFHGDYTDAVGGVTGSPQNTPTFTTGQDGLANHAVSLDGTSQYVTYGSINNFTSQSYSFSFWIKPSNISSNPVLFYKGGFQANGYYAALLAGGLVSLTLNQSGASTGQSSVASVANGSWYNVVITRSGSTVKTYVNGVDQTDTHVAMADAISSSDPFVIGAYVQGSPINFYSGLIQDFGVYSTVLTQPQAQALFNGGAR